MKLLYNEKKNEFSGSPKRTKGYAMKYETFIKNGHINENFSINTFVDDILKLTPKAQRILKDYGISNPHSNEVMSIFARCGIFDIIVGERLQRTQYTVINVGEGYSKSVLILQHKDGGKIAMKVNKVFFTKKEHDLNLVDGNCESQLIAEYNFYKLLDGKREQKVLAKICKYFQYKGVLVSECADKVLYQTSELENHIEYENFKATIRSLNTKYGLADVLNHIDNIGIFGNELKVLDYGINDIR